MAAAARRSGTSTESPEKYVKKLTTRISQILRSFTYLAKAKRKRSVAHMASVAINNNPMTSQGRPQRRPLHLMIKGRVQSRSIYAKLIDISEGGCKLSATQGFANLGDRVTIRINGINAPLGKVVWIDGKTAGVTFESRMHVAVLDHLCANIDSASEQQKNRMHRV